MPIISRWIHANRTAMSYVLALFFVVVTTGVRLALNPLLGRRAALIMYFPALVFSAWIGGWGGGMLVLALSTLAATYFFLSPHHSLFVSGQADQLTLLIFGVVGLSVSALSASQRRARQQAEETANALRESDAALGESERLLRTTLAGAPLVLWRMDTQGVITLAEGSGLALAGRTKEDYVGRSVFATSENPTLLEAWQQALAGENVAYDTESGSRLFHNELRPQRDAGRSVTGVIGVAFDVTEREMAAVALRESAERQKTLLRDVLVSVTEGKLLLSNSPAQLPLLLTSLGDPIPLTPEAGLYDLRRRAETAAREASHTEERIYDLITAASEAGMNAIVHGGGGIAWVSAGANGTIQVRVEDHGGGIAIEDLPKAALARGFSTGASLGHGLKMMLETGDRLYLMTGPEGTTVVLEQERERPLPPWL